MRNDYDDLTEDTFDFKSGLEVANAYKQYCGADPDSYSVDEEAIVDYEEQKSFENYVEFRKTFECGEQQEFLSMESSRATSLTMEIEHLIDDFILPDAFNFC